MALDLAELVRAAVPAFGELITDPSEPLLAFIYDRLASMLREQGYSVQEVDAVLALRPILGDVPRRSPPCAASRRCPRRRRSPQPTSAWATS
jgi:glycyl-tRNA synthetase beta chain